MILSQEASGGGGGGRISVKAQSHLLFTGTFGTAGGRSAVEPGGSGTAYIEEPSKTMIGSDFNFSILVALKNVSISILSESVSIKPEKKTEQSLCLYVLKFNIV